MDSFTSDQLKKLIELELRAYDARHKAQKKPTHQPTQSRSERGFG